MSMNASGGAIRAAVCAWVLAATAGTGALPARAASNFPDIPVWAIAGVWQDSSLVNRLRCVGSFKGPLPESLRIQGRAITVRFLRDRAAELRPDFGGYRIYRMTTFRDSASAVLVRRFSLNPGNELSWKFSRVTRSSKISLLPGLGDGTFGPRQDIASGVAPVAVARADLNRDSLLDVVVADELSQTASRYVGVGSSGLAAAGSDLTIGTPTAIAVGDMDGDTVSDAIVVIRGRNLIQPLLSSVTVHNATYSTGLQPSGVAIADLNGDRRVDVAVTNEGSNTVSVFSNDGSGELSTRTDFPTGLNPGAIALADLNADGLPDIVVANRGSNTVSVLRAVGISFAERVDFATGNAPSAVAIKDVNGDTFPDLAVTNSADGTVSVLRGYGTTSFRPQNVFPTGASPSSVAIDDLNGDGKEDLAVTNEGAASVSVLLGDGLGGFGAGSDFATRVNPSSVLIGEFTGDKVPDLLVTNHSYTLPYICNSAVVDDSLLTFVDPDSNGQYRKVCRRIAPDGHCLSPGDSTFILVPPPGPHDGFLTWYSITFERRNTTDPDYEDLFLPDTLDNFARCVDPADRATCANLNHKLRNVAGPVEPTPGPSANLERVLAVPNPYRGHEVWDQPGEGEVHFINLPAHAKIRIYTTAGDLVREIEHLDTIRDFERWDLKNASGRLVASGIYMYRVESATFHFQNRLVVIR